MPPDPAPGPAGRFVLVAGWPAAGKSTLARALAAELGLPLLAKDEIKEALIDGLGYPQTVAQSRRLGRAAVLAMLRVAQRCPGAVLDSTWFEYADPLVRQLRGRCAEVICTVPVQVDTSGPVDIRGLAATLTRLLDAPSGTWLP
jgi:predicted kinase